MNRKKYLLLLWILIGLGCAGGLVYVAGRALLLRRALELRSGGLAAAKAGDDATACDLLLQYVRRRPGDTDAIQSFIDSRRRVPMTTGQQYADTVGVVKLMLQQAPDQIDDKRYLLELYVKLERGPEAIDTAGEILGKVPNDGHTLELVTEVLTQQHKYEEALKYAERWSAAAPDDLQAHLERLGLYFQVGRPLDQIIAAAQHLREAHPGDAKFEVLQGYAYTHGKTNALALQWLQTAGKHPDLNDTVAQALIDQFDILGDSTDALAVLQDRVSKGAGPDLRDLLGRRSWELGHWKEAVDALNDLNPADHNADPTLLAIKAFCLARLNQPVQSNACRKALEANSRPDARAWASLLHRLIDQTALDDKQLTVDLRTAILVDSANPYLTYYLGDSQLRLGELDLAISAFERAASLDMHWDRPAVRLVECLLAKGQTEEALNIASFIAARNPNDAGAAITLAKAWAAGVESGATGQSDNLLAYVSDMQKQLPGENGTLPIIKVQILAKQGKRDDAIAAARDAINRTPPPPETVFRLISLLSRRYNLGLQAECFAAWQRALGITPALAFMEAVNEFAAGHAPEGLQLFDRLANQSGNSTGVDWALARAQYLDAIGDPNAKAAWVALRDGYPGNLSVQQSAVIARSVRGDWGFMQPAIENLHKLTGDSGLSWRLAQAQLKIESPRGEDDYEKGSVELNALIEGYPQLAQPHVLLSRALVHMQRLDGAVDHLTIATKLDPASVQTSLELIALLQSRGDSAKAATELDRVCKLPMSPQQRQDVALLLSKQGDTARALALLDQARAAESANGVAMQDDNQDLLMAVLYHQQGQNDKAETTVRKLLDRPTIAVIQFAASLFLSDGHPADAEHALSLLDTMTTLKPADRELIRGSYYYSQAHNLPEAARWFTAAIKLTPANVNAWQALAVCQMAQGQAAQAMATVDQAHAALPNDPSLAALKSHSQLLIDAGQDDNLHAVAMSVLANPLNSDVALQLIKIVQDNHRANTMESLASALTQLIQKNPDNQPAQLQLVQCYLDMGRYQAAQAAAQRAMAVFPNDPKPAQAAMLVCQTLGDWTNMESAAQNWKARAPQAAEGADGGAANAETHMHNYQAALSRLQPYLPAMKSDPGRHADLLATYATASVGAGDVATASDLLWPFAQSSQLGRQDWMRLAANQLDAATASDWLNRVATVIPADSIIEQSELAEAYDKLGRRMNDPALISNAADRFTQLAADPKADAMVILAAGGEMERSGKLPEAEALYRKTIALDPNSWVARNNLAMVIINRGGDLKEAVQLAQSAVAAQPHKADVYDTLGEAQSKSGDPKSAADSMRVAILLEPDSLQWRVSLARYLLNANNLIEATQALNEIDAHFPDVRAQSADLQQELADIRKLVQNKGT